MAAFALVVAFLALFTAGIGLVLRLSDRRTKKHRHEFHVVKVDLHAESNEAVFQCACACGATQERRVTPAVVRQVALQLDITEPEARERLVKAYGVVDDVLVGEGQGGLLR
jgi:hypothetical protein